MKTNVVDFVDRLREKNTFSVVSQDMPCIRAEMDQLAGERPKLSEGEMDKQLVDYVDRIRKDRRFIHYPLEIVCELTHLASRHALNLSKHSDYVQAYVAQTSHDL